MPRLFLVLTAALLLLLCSVHSQSQERKERKWLKVRKSAEEIHLAIQTLVSQGRVLDALAYCDEVEDEFGTLYILPNASPSLFSLKGASLYQLQRMGESEEQFLLAVRHNPNETRAWINIGEIRVQTFRLTEAISALERAFKLGDLSTVPRIVRTKGWSMDWKDFELYASDLEKHAKICAEDNRSCRIDSAGGFEYTDIGAEETLTMERISPHAAQSTQLIDKRELASYWPLSEFGRTTRSEKRMRVGFVSSDFGVHPVATLIRGLFQFIDRSKFEVFCFSLNPQISWWGSNISALVDHFVSLPPSKNVRDGAEAIASFRIEVLIELNGHTLHSGLNLLSHRPAPVQMTYLGLPTTSGSDFVDYFVGDRVASPPELRGYFTEKLVLMHPCYIANDYAQLQGDLLQMPQASRSDFVLTKREDDPEQKKKKEEDKEKEQERMRERERLALNATLLLGTLSNSQKVDPLVFHTWMNILRRFAGSKMVFNRYAGHTYYEPNINKEAKLHGVAPQRVFTLDQRGWIDHLAAKSALDLVLDTRAKNGHTTGLDGVWAGVPTLTFGGGKEMQARAGQSIAAALNCDFGVAFSLKEYEDIAEAVLLKRRRSSLSRRTQRKIDKMVERHRASTSVSSSLSGETESDVAFDSSPVRARVTKQEMLATMPDFSPLRKWRDHVQRLRNTSYLFDTRNWTRTFERLLEASWEAYHITSRNNLRPFHIFSQTTMPDYAQSKYVVPASQMYAQGSKFFDRPGHNMEETANIRAPSPHKQSYDEEEDEREGDEEVQNLSESDSSSFSPSHSSSSSDKRPVKPKTKTKTKTKRKKYLPIPDYVFDGRLILLNIGGVRPANGWLNVNAQPAKNTSKNHVDLVREMHDLRGLPNNSVSGIYSSHTLEHVPMGNGMVNRTLAEWHRVLRPGGILLLSVPDLENIARMYLDKSFTVQDRWFLTNVLFGGQHDSFDFHHFGYSADILGNILKIAGFCDIRRVGPFNMAFRDDVGFFTDSSDLVYKGYLLSLNVVAKVCPEDKPGVPYDDFAINANPIPYAGYFAENYPKEIRETYFAEGKIRKADD